MNYFDEKYYPTHKGRSWIFTFFLMLFSAVLGGVIAVNLAIHMNLLVKESSLSTQISQNAGSGGTQPNYVTIPDPNMDTSTTVSAVASIVSPTIVNITNYSTTMSFFSWQQTESQSSGSGVIVDPNGLIVTNNHVIAGASKIVVSLADGSQYEAKLLGADTRTDLALLKIEAKNLTAVTFGDSDQLKVGEMAIAIGNPGGEEFARSVTCGVISGLNRLLVTSEGLPFRLIQTDAAINPGNSGGALVNARGEVIGINTVKISNTNFEGMGFAIPSNMVTQIVKSLQENGRVVRPGMGVAILGDVDEQVAAYNKLSVNYGVMVVPQRGGAAQKAGLADNDIITAVDGVKIATSYQLQEIIFSHKIGDKLDVQVARGSKTLHFTVTLTELTE